MHVCTCVAEIKSCHQPHVISSEIVFGNESGFVLCAHMSRISFNNGRKNVWLLENVY